MVPLGNERRSKEEKMLFNKYNMLRGGKHLSPSPTAANGSASLHRACVSSPQWGAEKTPRPDDGDGNDLASIFNPAGKTQ